MTYIINSQPIDISTPDEVKINGHNLKGKKSILKPVNKDTMAIIMRKHDETI